MLLDDADRRTARSEVLMRFVVIARGQPAFALSRRSRVVPPPMQLIFGGSLERTDNGSGTIIIAHAPSRLALQAWLHWHEDDIRDGNVEIYESDDPIDD